MNKPPRDLWRARSLMYKPDPACRSISAMYRPRPKQDEPKPTPPRLGAPPVYRPHQVNAPSPQLKPANDFRVETRPAPPVYQPHQVNTPSAQLKPANDFRLETRPAPPVYQPNQVNAPSAQLKPANNFKLETRPAPPVYQPNQVNAPSAQLKPANNFKLTTIPAPPVSRLQAKAPSSLCDLTRPGRATKQSWETSYVVQRLIAIEGATYGSGDKEAFKKKYAIHLTSIEGALIQAEFESCPRSIDDALDDTRTVDLSMEDLSKWDLGFGFTVTGITQKATTVSGGLTQEAKSKPVLVNRPEQGFHELEMTGLIMCVGIVLEARVGGRITAVVGAHFLTPTYIQEQQLNIEGKQYLAELVKMLTDRGGDLTAELIISHEHKDGLPAAKLVGQFLTSKGVSSFDIGYGSSYKLQADGSGTVTTG